MMSGCGERPENAGLETVSMAFQPWPGYGLWYLARDKGFCKAEGIDLFIVDAPLDSDRRDALKLGMLDCEAGTVDLLVSKRAQGVPVKAVMEIDESNGADGIVAMPDIGKVEDLAGRSIVLAQDDVGDAFVSYLLDKKGIPRDKVRIVLCKPDEAATTFLNDGADAVATWEPQLSEALKRAGSRILVTSRDEPGIIVDTLNVREDVLRTRPKAVKALMRSWFRALEYYTKNPKESSEIIGRYYGMSPEDYRKATAGWVWEPYNGQVEQGQDAQLKGLFASIARIKYHNKRIGEQPDPSGAFNMGLIKELYEDSR
jgi:NitT/TauT family transport system substrate-binding protein